MKQQLIVLHSKSTRRLLTKDLAIVKLGQRTRTIFELAPHFRDFYFTSTSLELGGCPTSHPKSSQIYSIGDKSGDRAGQGRTVTVRKQSCDTLAV
ncbi:hypothetical protein TNCV_2626511 [Trichonephila clavipes]|uniref:Uncharacterized protein n=1 Tax=Trichonephila clavipes TaxID=2585209 RepID=A0A8X6W726_TRICX|nr:hypothetical protein TNCV_2626511 [Trichonephila clavipes]